MIPCIMSNNGKFTISMVTFDSYILKFQEANFLHDNKQQALVSELAIG